VTVTFRIGRYLVALLWSWSFPFMVGAALGGAYISVTTLEILEASDDAFISSLESVVLSCKAPPDPPPKTQSAPVSGTGLPVAGTGGETG
jgi:hypothetical protein